jgi:hypothetical protein
MNNLLAILIDEARQETTFVGPEQLKLAKRLFPLTRVMRTVGDAEFINKTGQPCHLCNSPGATFRVFQCGGRWTFSCTGKCGKYGDQVDYLRAKFGLSDGEAIRLLGKFIKR